MSTPPDYVCDFDFKLPYHSPIILRHVGAFWLYILVLLIKIYFLKLVLR